MSAEITGVNTEILQIPLDTIVEHPDQPRYGAGDVAALADSIAELGVLEPIMVLFCGDEHAERWTVLSGHRRVAAARELGHTHIPGFGIDAGVGRSDQVRALLATNTAREALTPIEEARGYQTMLELGIPAKAIAKVVGRKVKVVERTAALSGAFGDGRLEQVVAKPLTLEESEGLARHAGNEDRFAQLLKHAGTSNFEGILSRLDYQAKREAVQEKASRKLQAEGCKIVDGNTYSSKRAELVDLLDEKGKKITPKAHAGCPGHAAVLHGSATDDKDAITYVCTDWKKHGHTHRYRTEGGVDDKQAEAARLEREWRKRQKAVLEDRRAWEWLADPASTAKADPFLLQAAFHRGFDLDEKGEVLVFDWLGLTLPEPKHKYDACREEKRAAIATKDPLRAMLAMACAHGDELVRLSKPPSAYGSWWYGETAARYLRFLEADTRSPGSAASRAAACTTTTPTARTARRRHGRRPRRGRGE